MLINKLKPLGVVNTSLIDIKLSDYAKRVIKIVSDEVLGYFDNDINKLNSNLRSLNDIVVVRSASIYNPSDCRRMISNCFGLSNQDINSKLKVLRKIEDNINKK